MSGVLIIPPDLSTAEIGLHTTPNAYRVQIHMGDFSRLKNYGTIYTDIVIIGSEQDRAALEALKASGSLPDYTFYERSNIKDVHAHMIDFASRQPGLWR